MAAAGIFHTLLLRSDGMSVAFGENVCGQCNIPILEKGVTYIQVAAGGYHTILLRSDGTCVACGDNSCGQFNIPFCQKVWHTLKLLEVTTSLCWSKVMALLLLAGGMTKANAISPLWRKV